MLWPVLIFSDLGMWISFWIEPINDIGKWLSGERNWDAMWIAFGHTLYVMVYGVGLIFFRLLQFLENLLFWLPMTYIIYIWRNVVYYITALIPMLEYVILGFFVFHLTLYEFAMLAFTNNDQLEWWILNYPGEYLFSLIAWPFFLAWWTYIYLYGTI